MTAGFFMIVSQPLIVRKQEGGGWAEERCWGEENIWPLGTAPSSSSTQQPHTVEPENNTPL